MTNTALTDNPQDYRITGAQTVRTRAPAGRPLSATAWLAAGTTCALLACTKSPPAEEAASQPIAPAGAEAPTGTVLPPATKATQAPPAAPTLRTGLSRPTLPDTQLVDVLLRVPAPLLPSQEVDTAARAALRELRKLAGTEAVFSRATAGELRVVVRTNSGDRTGALARVTAAWQAHAAADFGPPIAEAIARGARARVAWAITDAATEGQVTAAARASLDAWAAALSKASRIHLAGAGVPTFYMDVLTRTAAENQLTLQAIVDNACASLTAMAAKATLLDSAESELVVHQQLDRVPLARHRSASAQALPDVPATRALALRRAFAIAPRPALVGRNPVLLMLADGGVGVDVDALVAQEGAARRVQVTRAKLSPAGQLLPQTVDAAQRFVLQLRPGERPESPEGMAKRLLAVRDIPNIVSALAVRGWDGIPASLDSSEDKDRRWTVWLTPSGGKIEDSLQAAREILGRGPWQAIAIPTNLDTSLAWLLDQPAAAGLLVTAADAALVSSVTGAIGSAAQRSATLADVAAGPNPRLPNGQFGRIDAQAARLHGLSSRVLSTAQALLQGALYCGEVGGAELWFALPQGEMAAEQGRLPLAWTAGSQALPASAVDLGMLQRLPSPDQVLDRLRVDDQPSLFLLANSTAGSAVEAALALRDAVERQGAMPGVRLTSWTLRGALQDQPACVP